MLYNINGEIMEVTIYPQKLKGEVIIPPSKSLTHRALICASLADGISTIYNPLYSDDTYATISCLKSLGVKIDEYKDKIIVHGVKEYSLRGRLDAKDSASTIRFLIPIISLFINDFTFYGSKRLMERINTPDLLALDGLKFTFALDCVNIKGKLNNNLHLSDNITSQFISGILFTTPYTNILLKNYDNPYIDLTKSMINYFLRNNKYEPQEIEIESDFSSASFFIAMMLNNDIKINNLHFNSLQGDKRIISIFEEMGARFKKDSNTLTCLLGMTNGITINLSKNPDLVPIVAAVASISKGRSRITGIEKLQYKESNRIKSIYESLKAIGADIEIENHDLIINGKEFLEGNNTISGFHDHRIIMSLVALSSKVKYPYVIKGYEDVKKSFPNFWDLYQLIGGKYDCKISK